MASLVDIQKKVILDVIRHTGGHDWKVLVLDDITKNVVLNAVPEDDILNENVSNIETIESRRQTYKDTSAVYILHSEPYIADCIVADIQRRRYRKLHIIWVSRPTSDMRNTVYGAADYAKDMVAEWRVLSIDYLPRERCLALFRDPWSFEVLYNPSCGALVRKHLEELSHKIANICVSLGEYPLIRYYRPSHLPHEARVLCPYLAKFVQQALDEYAKSRPDFPPPSTRPRGTLYILDRTLDLYAPLIHEFTYQAMVHDLLPIKESDKVGFETTLNEGKPTQEIKEMEISEGDIVWTRHRHLHMKDVLPLLVDEFKRFRKDNAAFDESSENPANINLIKDMLAGLREYQYGKDRYTLHLNMAQECMKLFQEHKLLDVACLEQILATGYDEDGKKPRQVAEELIRLLDDPAILPSDRLRLILIYVLFRHGLLAGDIHKLILHARLTQRDAEAVRNLDLLGSRGTKPLKDATPPLRQLFPQRPPPKPSSNDPDNDDSNVSRYEPCLKKLLEEHIAGTLDQEFFPSTQPTPDGNASGSPDVPTPNTPNQDHLFAQSQSSLRSSKPTWARSRTAGSHPGSALARDSSGDEARNRKNDQRILVFMAGGATYSELRSCYEVSNNPQVQKEVFLLTTHMLSPALWCRQLADLSLKRERLGLPVDRPKKAAPRHLWEDEPKKSPAGGTATPTGPRTPVQAPTPSSRNGATPASAQTPASAGSGKSHHLPFGKSKKQGGPAPASAPGSAAGSYNSASAGPSSAATAPAGGGNPVAGMSALSLNGNGNGQGQNGKEKKFGHGLMGRGKKDKEKEGKEGKEKKKHLFKF